jgi:hypothetical protein
MSVKTKSLFFYVAPIVLDSRFLDFSEGAGDIVAQVPIGARSPEDLTNVVSIAMNDVGTLNYVLTFDRLTNKLTISGDSNFELNVQSGPNSFNNVFPILGFTNDRSGASSYEAEEVYANTFRPQFLPQNYLDPTKWTKAVKATVNESADGTTETFSFGKKSFYQMNFKFITNIDQGNGGIIETDLTAEENAQAFLSFAIDKTPFEFMPDRDDQNTFDKVLLESTQGNKDGLGFKLKQLNSQGLDGYYETGTLVFRKLE